MPLKQRDLIGHIIHTARCIERMCDNYARQTGVTGSQSRLLCFLSIVSLEQDVYQKDIEEEFGIRASSATGLLQALELQGLIRREPVSLDGRLKKIILTDKARESQSRIVANYRESLKKLRGSLSDRDLSFFMTLCKGFAERASKAGSGKELFSPTHVSAFIAEPSADGENHPKKETETNRSDTHNPPLPDPFQKAEKKKQRQQTCRNNVSAQPAPW